MRRDAQASQKAPRDLESGQDWVGNFGLVNMRVLGITSYGVTYSRCAAGSLNRQDDNEHRVLQYVNGAYAEVAGWRG